MELGKTLVFNGMSKKFFLLPSVNIPELKAILESPNSYSLHTEYRSFLSLLKSNGFLIENDVDELEKLRNLFEAYKEAKVYSLMILTTYTCNFSCWYCVQKHKNEYLSMYIVPQDMTNRWNDISVFTRAISL